MPFIRYLTLTLAASLVVRPAADVPAMRASRDRGIDVQHVAIALEFDWTKKRSLGTTTITFAPLSSTNRISLDAANLLIRSITLASGRPLVFHYDGNARDGALMIELDQVYDARRAITLTIKYETEWVNDSDPNNLGGSDGKGIRYFSPTFTEPVKRKQIWSGGVPGSNRYWFPGYDSPDDLRTTEFTATVPQPLQAISNGTLVSTKSNADGTRTFHWRMDTPYANQLTNFIIGEYTDIAQSYRGTPLHSFGYRDEAEAVRASVVRLADMTRFFSEATGVRYPFASYSQVFVQDHPWGFGGAGVSTMTENMVDDAPTHADYFYLWDGLEAEALASQWFGAHVMARSWSDAWLNRGFSHYVDAMYTQHKNGNDELLLFNLFNDQNTYFADWNSGNRRPVVVPESDQSTDLANDNYPYVRGALVLHMLRKELGEAAWQKSLQLYTRANAGKLVTTDDLKRAAEEASGRKLDWFFDQWLYKMGHPVFDVAKRYDASSEKVTLTIRQVQKRDTSSTYPQAEYFAGQMNVAIDNVVKRISIEAKAENVFTFDVSREPRIVSFDREGTWIKQVTFTKPVSELVDQMMGDSDAVGRRWASMELGRIGRSDSTSAAEKLRIANALRRYLDSKGHWRLRLTGLIQLQGVIAPNAQQRAVPLDSATVSMLMRVMAKDSAWTRAQAVTLLGVTRDDAYADLYIKLLRDKSHVVSYAAATALGRTKSPKAYAALEALSRIPSWKGENRLSALNGFKELRDPRAESFALEMLSDQQAPRWTLAISRWDYRIAAAEVLAALGKRDRAFDIVNERFTKSLAEGDVNDMFSNVLLMVTLEDKRAATALVELKARFKDDANALAAVSSYEKRVAELTANTMRH